MSTLEGWELLTPQEYARMAKAESAREWVRRNPGWSLRRFAKAWGVSKTTVVRTFDLAGIVPVGYGSWGVS